MMRRFYALLSLVVALLMPIGAWADSLQIGNTFTADGILYQVSNNNPNEVSVGVTWWIDGKYHEELVDVKAIKTDTVGVVDIPSSVIGTDGQSYSVTSIQYRAFRGCSGITDVSIGDNIRTIDEGAFMECEQLKSVSIPASVISIDKQAFAYTHLETISIPNSITKLAESIFAHDIYLTSVYIPSSVTSIGENAFYNCHSLPSIVIPGSVKAIGAEAFHDCDGLTVVTSLIEEPFSLVSEKFGFPVEVFGTKSYNATLYVPAGTKAKYEATEGWNLFKNIVEMVELDPIDGETTVSTDNLGDKDLSDNVVNDVYYNVGSEGYDASDKSVVISQTTNMGQITDATPGSSEVKENFNGLILKVAAGKGTITVNVKTTGNAQLVVQVGSQTPMIASKTEQGDVVVSYNVAEDTYVYIYAIIGSSAAPARRAAPADAVKIYSIKVTPGATGIDTVHSAQSTVHSCYTLDGRKLQGQPTKKGVYIVNGRQVVVK